MKIFFPLRFNLLMIAVVIACQSTEQFPAKVMLKPGDRIHGMTLTNGTAEAVPLWAFCSSVQKNEQMLTTECHIPLSTRLAIGQVFFPTDKALTELDWSEFTWELSIDGRSLDLDAFGTYDYVSPAISHPPCPIREVFIKSTGWDIVLSELKPGTYLFRGQAQSETESYTWIINLIVEPSEAL
ncbi:MAG TPA: hypothetical protein VFQ23_10645 [Anaerolineales bacterium]|nr:hypothetical protein [Anaerolineales bacterium]